MARFQYYQDARGEWRWRFRASNHKIIAVSSEGYTNKVDCLHSISLVKTQASDASAEASDD